jgi:hypothetical protein
MIGRMYGVGIASQAQTAAKTLVEVAAPADSVVFVERASIGQTSFDTSENLGSTFQRITTTGTGTATTPRPLQVGDAAFGGVVETNSTIEPTYDANGVLVESGFNVLSGLLWTPANDDEVMVISPSLLWGMNLDVAPSGSMNFSYGVTLREIGG